MSGIISSVPWKCDDRECKHQWHLANYWIQDDGTYTVDRFSDGDHEAVEQHEIPTAQMERAASLEYCHHVAVAGLDPLGIFNLPTSKKKTRQWQARLADWIGSSKHGLRVTGVRRRGRGPWMPATEAPACVRDFLFGGHPQYVYGTGNAENCHLSIGVEAGATYAALVKFATNCTVKRKYWAASGREEITLAFVVDEPAVAWSDKRISAWLRTAARRAIRELQERADRA